jgi:hypothetical protein
MADGVLLLFSCDCRVLLRGKEDEGMALVWLAGLYDTLGLLPLPY